MCMKVPAFNCASTKPRFLKCLLVVVVVVVVVIIIIVIIVVVVSRMKEIKQN